MTALELARKLLALPDEALGMEVEIVLVTASGRYALRNARPTESVHFWSKQVRSVRPTRGLDRDRLVLITGRPLPAEGGR